MGDTNLQATLDRHKSKGSFKERLSFGRSRRPKIPALSNPTASDDHAAANSKQPNDRPKTAPDSSVQLFRSKRHLDREVKRDSGLAPSNSTAQDSQPSLLPPDDVSAQSLAAPSSLPNIQIEGEPLPPTTSYTSKEWTGGNSERKTLPGSSSMDDVFLPLNIYIPSGSLDDLTPQKFNFSKRGSMFIGGKKANSPLSDVNGHLRVGSRRLHSNVSPSSRLKPPSSPLKTLSAEEESLSQKVRSMYESAGEESATLDDRSSGQDHAALTEETVSVPASPMASATDLTSDGSMRVSTSLVRKSSNFKREPNELAGGIEDWQDLKASEVDRYGFIIQTANASANGLSQLSPDLRPLQRVSTCLQIATGAPRRKHTIRRAVSHAKSSRLSTSNNIERQPSRLSNRPSSQGSNRGSVNGTSSKLRYVVNRLPNKKDRRVMDEAFDMLTLPPGLANIAENQDSSQALQEIRRKEIERNDKWLKMAKQVTKNQDGGGMVFEFDTTSPKLIERTWKGIPDRWRSTAWQAFLTASAKKVEGSPSDEELMIFFQDSQDQGSPDDVQIDIDVPRTINSHIMFRRRYRGGQRLLFRVLHAMSLYFPNTGYVQGMATLGATLLCYYDEENAFMMLVRLWQLRGLERLYGSGFTGLMEALDDFEKKWLGGGEIAEKLNELGITPTAYGTRWYLTLFNYSIPFPAQLRVWDVFMLLGDADDGQVAALSARSDSFGATLDVLHAASAALIDGTREVLLDSDFEDAMKVLTSWIPVKDEELFMRVAKAEWKLHHKRKA